MMAERSRSELADEDEVHVPTSWRRYRQALQAMNEATEAEDYQAVGIKCETHLSQWPKNTLTQNGLVKSPNGRRPRTSKAGPISSPTGSPKGACGLT